MREIYALIPNTHSINDDVTEVLHDTAISETERDQLIRSRLGQGAFRHAVIAFWKQCAVTGCKEIALLYASHIKPWRVSNNLERLDQFNGLLLTPNLDAAFDRGMITFDANGKIQISSFLSEEDAVLLGLNSSLSLKLNARHQKYMSYHRENVFKS